MFEDACNLSAAVKEEKVGENDSYITRHERLDAQTDLELGSGL